MLRKLLFCHWVLGCVRLYVSPLKRKPLFPIALWVPWTLPLSVFLARHFEAHLSGGVPRGQGVRCGALILHSSRRSTGFPRSLPTVSYCFRAGTCRDRDSRFPTQLRVALLTFHVVFRSFSEGTDPHVATIWCVQRRRGGQGLPVPLSWTLFLALIFPDILLEHVKSN